MDEIKILSINNRECIYYNIKEAHGTLLVGIVVRGGSILEKEHEKGYTHFLEHVLLSFSKKNKEIRCRGYTDFYYTYYIFSVTSDMFNVCMELIDEILAGKYITTQNVEMARKDVIEEYEEHKESKKEFNYIFEGTDYINHLAIGKIENIQSCNSYDLLDFFKKKYKPEFIDIILIGDIGRIEAKNCVAKKQNFEGQKKEISLLKNNKGFSIHTGTELNGMNIYFYRKKCYKGKVSYVTEILLDEILFSLIESITDADVSKFVVSAVDELICIKLSSSWALEDIDAFLSYIDNKINSNSIRRYLKEYKKQYTMYISKGVGINLENELLRCINDIVYNGEIIGYREIISITERQLEIISTEQILEAYQSSFNHKALYTVIKKNGVRP